MTDKPRFGPGGNCDGFAAKYKGKGILAPRWVAENGLDVYEYEAGRGIMASEESLVAFGAAAKHAGIALTFHAPYFISLSSVEPEKRDNSIRYIAESLYAAELMDAEIIVVHTGSASKITRAEAMTLAADTVYRALETLPCNGVAIGLETMGKINQLGTLEEVITLCKMDSRLSPMVDFGHLNARSIGTAFPTADEYARVFTRIAEELGDEKAKHLHCHFSRIEYTEKGGEKRHVTLEDTSWGPDPEPLLRVISDMRLAPTIISESAGTQTRDALYMKQYFERISSHE